jgi:phospholipid-translocating ATPase
MDNKLYDKKINRHCGVLNASIVEELGVVDCILTDKTGTLTANEMVFKNIVIENKVYSREYINENIEYLR